VGEAGVRGSSCSRMASTNDVAAASARPSRVSESWCQNRTIPLHSEVMSSRELLRQVSPKEIEVGLSVV
jgi:hypothetical protein